MNWANILTGTRAVLLVPITALILLGSPFWALVVYLVAAVTDFFDGVVARATGSVTKFGAKFDGSVDFVMSILIFFWSWWLLPVPAIIWLLLAFCAIHLVYALFSLYWFKRILALHLPYSKIGTGILFSAFPMGLIFRHETFWLSFAVLIVALGRLEAILELARRRDS